MDFKLTDVEISSSIFLFIFFKSILQQYVEKKLWGMKLPKECVCSFGPIHNTMQILHLQIKGAHLNTIERFYIYVEYTKGNHLNDGSIISPNKIFDMLLKPHQP